MTPFWEDPWLTMYVGDCRAVLGEIEADSVQTVAVLEGDAQDCSSADCIADAVYEIVRVRLIGEAALSSAPPADAPLDVETATAARAWLAGDTKGLNGAMTDLAARLTDGDG